MVLSSVKFSIKVKNPFEILLKRLQCRGTKENLTDKEYNLNKII